MVYTASFARHGIGWANAVENDAVTELEFSLLAGSMQVAGNTERSHIHTWAWHSEVAQTR